MVPAKRKLKLDHPTNDASAVVSSAIALISTAVWTSFVHFFSLYGACFPRDVDVWSTGLPASMWRVSVLRAACRLTHPGQPMSIRLRQPRLCCGD